MGGDGKQARCFPFAFPYAALGSGKRNGKWSALELVAGGGFEDATVCDERCESLADIAGAHAHGFAHLLLRERGCGVGEQEFDAAQAGRLDGRRVGGRLVDGLQGEGRRIGFEREQHAVGALGGAMFDAKQQLLTLAAEIEIGVTSGVQFRGAAQRLTAALMGGALAGMMDEGDRGLVKTL